MKLYPKEARQIGILKALSLQGNYHWIDCLKSICKLDVFEPLTNDRIVTKHFGVKAGFMGFTLKADGMRITKEGYILASSNDGVLLFGERQISSEGIRN